MVQIIYITLPPYVANVSVFVITLSKTIDHAHAVMSKLACFLGLVSLEKYDNMSPTHTHRISQICTISWLLVCIINLEHHLWKILIGKWLEYGEVLMPAFRSFGLWEMVLEYTFARNSVPPPFLWDWIWGSVLVLLTINDHWWIIHKADMCVEIVVYCHGFGYEMFFSR